jgi:hypothetical protein
MIIHAPCYITSRLMAGIDVGDGTLSIEYGKHTDRHGRHTYSYAIDIPALPDGYESSDLSGMGNLQDGLKSLLAFLAAAAEAYRWNLRGGDSENSDLFPPEIMEWAYQNADEISMAELDLETPNLIKEN